MADMDIVCLSSAYWDQSLWTNRQHIMSRVSREQRVLYVEPGLFNKSYFRSLLRSNKGRLVRWFRQENENLWVFSPSVLPLYRGGHIAQSIGWSLALRQIKRFMHEHAFQDPIVWIYQPEAVEILDQLPASLVLYDCVDEHAAIPYYASSPMRQATLQRAERDLMLRADLVITTSQYLYERKREYNPRTFLVHNVADADHFGQAMSDEIALADEITHLPHPIVGFVGAVSGYKLDVQLLASATRAYPDWQFVFIGPIGFDDQMTDVSMLRKESNVHLMGVKPYQDLPRYMKAFDVCIIPYQINDYTMGVFPIKLFEYLASGRPVVTTNLPAFADYRDVVHVADTREDFVRLLSQAVAQDTASQRKRRLAVARENTWEKRTTQILELIAQVRETTKGKTR
jgi:glycosyltransferase involved in cell wall biosynthesis